MFLRRLFAKLRRRHRPAYIEVPRAQPRTSWSDPLADSTRLFPPAPPPAPPLEPIVDVSAVTSPRAAPTTAPASLLNEWRPPDEAQHEPEGVHPQPSLLLNAWGPDESPAEAEVAAMPAPLILSPAQTGASAPPSSSTDETGVGDEGPALLKVVLADGSVTAPKLDQHVARPVAYLAREILPPDPEAEAALMGPGQLKVILEDGSVVAPEDPELQRQIDYLAKEILSPVDRPGRPS